MVIRGKQAGHVSFDRPKAEVLDKWQPKPLFLIRKLKRAQKDSPCDIMKVKKLY